jgi:hypothetical protein
MSRYNFICESGKHNNYFNERNNPPNECENCYETFEWSKVVEVQNYSDSEVTGLTIIYQITQQRLEISTLHKTILGRENFGANIFSQIFFNGKHVVSRKHCSIEFKDGKFYLLDEGSLNGTFYGVNKLSCKNSPQAIEDKSIFYIGEEAFIAQLNVQEAKVESVKKEIAEKQEEIKQIKLYRCNESGCGYETQTTIAVCPSCSTFNSLIAIYE